MVALQLSDLIKTSTAAYKLHSMGFEETFMIRLAIRQVIWTPSAAATIFGWVRRSKRHHVQMFYVKVGSVTLLLAAAYGVLVLVDVDIDDLYGVGASIY